jgi:hypothetical protein
MVGADGMATTAIVGAEVLEENAPVRPVPRSANTGSFDCVDCLARESNHSPQDDRIMWCVASGCPIYSGSSDHYAVVNTSYFRERMQQLFLQAVLEITAQNLRGKCFHSMTRVFG